VVPVQMLLVTKCIHVSHFAVLHICGVAPRIKIHHSDPLLDRRASEFFDSSNKGLSCTVRCEGVEWGKETTSITLFLQKKEKC
jgi:hypothetical protein